ncbi:histidine-type phosphatase [Marinibaculum pumilum]|uniref:Histidine-type phosphatase n=1 Tax=Marinibaculum pumilum TaxID=1766165 RepID=A0ABV7L4V0_9PROT
MRLLTAIIAAILFALPPADAGPAETPLQAVSPDWTLKGVVLLSRHGLRGPTKPVRCDGSPGAICLDAYAERPWPDLQVSAGHLTLAGYQRAVTMGRFYRSHYSAAGLLPATGCPDRDSLAFRSDTDERTIMTAGAVMDGMFPGCALHPVAVEPHLFRATACSTDRKKALAAAQGMAGGSWAALAKGKLRGPLAAMSEVLGRFAPAACAAHGAAAPCTLQTVPAEADAQGAIGIAGPLSEQFLMQYGGGLSGDEVAWGRLPEATGLPLAEAVGYVNAIHAASIGYAFMAPYQATHLGSLPLHRIRTALEELAGGRSPAFTFLAGHDTTILTVGGMLGLDWQLESYAPLQVPPGAGLVFELWQPPAGPSSKAQGGPVVRLVFLAQTIAQLHANAALDAGNPPAAAVLAVTGCYAGVGGAAQSNQGAMPMACPLDDFRRIAADTVDGACLRPAVADR